MFEYEQWGKFALFCGAILVHVYYFVQLLLRVGGILFPMCQYRTHF